MINLKVASFGNRESNNVALTFDDGPSLYSTEQILEILEYFNVKATFFVLGKRCIEYPEILKKIDQKGHLIGNHTFSHSKGDFEKCGEEISQIISKNTKYVRPPFYDLSFCSEEREYLEDKYVITGDVNSKDYLSIIPAEVLANVLTSTKNGSIIDLHDGSEIDSDLKQQARKTIEALPKIIRELQSRHFNLVRIDEMELEFRKFHEPLQG
jgi:peptidoglycan/xylan/chitin deacetylase (PgdA/CDA1 family)